MRQNVRFYLLILLFVVIVAGAWRLLGERDATDDAASGESAPRRVEVQQIDANTYEIMVAPADDIGKPADDAPVAPTHEDPETPKTTPGSVSGTVVHDVTGEPLFPVDVVVQSQADKNRTYRETTDAQGRFMIQGLSKGEYSIRIDDKTYSSRGRIIFTVLEGVETPGLRLRAIKYVGDAPKPDEGATNLLRQQ